jgi:hypothetical protein
MPPKPQQKQKKNPQNGTVQQQIHSKKSPSLMRRIKGVPRSLLGSLDERRYICALTDPFSPDANGAQIPDFYPFPLVPMKCVAIGTANADGGGNISHMITSHPHIVCAASGGSAFISSLPSWANNTTTAHLDIANLSSKYSSYRVVAFGCRIKLLQQPLNAQGRLLVAAVPCPATRVLNARILENTAIDDSTFNEVVCGIGLDALSGDTLSTILSLPESAEISCAHMINKNVDLVYRPCTHGAMMFNPTTRVGLASGTTGLTDAEGWDTATGAITSPAVTVDAMNPTLLDGHVAWIIRGLGFPNNGLTQLEYEFVWHVEGTPAMTTSTNGVGMMVPNAPEAKYGAGVLQRCLQAAFKNDFIKESAVDIAQSVVSTAFRYGMGF